MKNSTATGTTATAERPQGPAAPYRGRFAPSPTGPLHQGSLVAALASWLEARVHRGTWIIRMEDLDTPRCVSGAAEAILATLAGLGLVSDEPVICQSARRDAYAAALQALEASGHSYRCSCSRSDAPGPYAGHCRDLGLQASPAARRLRLPAGSICFDDAIQGRSCTDAAAIGDPVIFRRDGIAAYQLAVVVDDAGQGITHVVRGADLLDSTAWQICIAGALLLPVPRYMHVPLITEADGSKLAKSRHSLAINDDRSLALHEALMLLQQSPPISLKAAAVSDILTWATANWRPESLAGTRAVSLRS
ncbi:MAG: tRNA glutamyl-Q(34) synthetase GluQRS [Steroidobacteraceae bacterium]